MRVAELIEVLLKMPQDAKVIIDLATELEDEDKRYQVQVNVLSQDAVEIIGSVPGW